VSHASGHDVRVDSGPIHAKSSRTSRPPWTELPATQPSPLIQNI
jgi:hypothetical protein